MIRQKKKRADDGLQSWKESPPDDQLRTRTEIPNLVHPPKKEKKEKRFVVCVLFSLSSKSSLRNADVGAGQGVPRWVLIGCQGGRNVWSVGQSE